jgi:hypothetical protein
VLAPVGSAALIVARLGASVHNFPGRTPHEAILSVA